MKRALAALLLASLLGLGTLLLYDRPAGPSGGWLRAQHREARFLTIAGLRVRYVRSGSGPPVVLVHGFASSIYTWKQILPELTQTHEVLALDLPGFGESDQPPDLSFGLCESIVLGLMDRLGIARASLVGSSMGGALAAVLAARRPERVERLVLIDAAGFNLAKQDQPALIRLAAAGPAQALLAHAPVRRLLVTLALRQVFHDRGLVTEERVNEYLTAAARPGTLPAIRSLLDAGRLDASLVVDALPRVRAPCLVIWGANDAWIPSAHADRFVAAIRGARKVVVPACGHLPQEERPEVVARLLADFL